jgi:hypothetical protein
VPGTTRKLTVYAYGQPCDMRKSFDTLSALVKEGMGGEVLSGEVFLFVGRGRKEKVGRPSGALASWADRPVAQNGGHVRRGSLRPPDRSIPQSPKRPLLLTIEMTMRYAHLSPKARESAVQELDRPLPQPRAALG